MDRSSRPLGLTAEELLRQDRWLRALVRSLAGDCDVDDVVQQTWASALRRRAPVARPRAWLSVVAGNFVRRARRSVRLRAEREELAARPEATPSTEETLALLELQRHVMRAVRELREPYRTTVLLRYTHGLSFREIAARTDAGEDAVRQRLKRGLDALRAEVGARWGDDWRDLPGLAFWLIPGVVQMKKSTSIAAAAVAAASLGALFVWIDPPFGAREPQAGEAAAQLVAPPPAARDGRGDAPALGSQDRVAPAPLAAADAPPPAPPTSVLLAGRVLDVRGDPLAGVGVAAAARRLASIPSEGYGRPAVATTSGGDGSFELSTDLEHGELVTGPGWVPVAASFFGGEEEDFLLVAAPAIELSGAVSDAEGNPLAGVLVHVDRSELRDFDSALGGLRRVEWLLSATDELGRFRRRDLPAEMGRLRFEKEGYVATEVDIGALDRSDLWVTLEEDEVAYVVTGWVLAPGGAGVEGARVGLGDRTTRSGPGGAFELRIPGEQAPDHADALWAACPPWRTKTVERFGGALLEAPEKAQEVELLFDGAALALGGRVVDAEGAPVAGLTVYLWRQRELLQGVSAEELAVPEDREQLLVGPGLRVWSRTDADGRFRLDGLGDREYRLRLFDRERFAAHTTEPLRAGDEDVLLTLPSDFVRAEVTGRAVDLSGAGVPGVKLTPQLGTYLTTRALQSEGNARTFETDEEGRFTLTDVSGGDLLLSIFGESVMPTSHFLRAGDPVEDLELVVELQCDFRVVLTGELARATGLEVLDAAGERLNVAALGGGEFGWSTWRSFEGGRTRVLSVGQSAATLVLYDDQHEEVGRLPLALRPGAVNTVDG